MTDLEKQAREEAANFAFIQRDDDKGGLWNAACDHIANAFRHEANPFGNLLTFRDAQPAGVVERIIRAQEAADAKASQPGELLAPRPDREAVKKLILNAWTKAQGNQWSDDLRAGHAADAILSLLPSEDGWRDGLGLAWWAADIQRRADICKVLYDEAGSPSIDRCEKPEGSSHLFAYLAFDRVAKDMRAALLPSEDGWRPHLDYAGEPIREGEFRDPPAGREERHD